MGADPVIGNWTLRGEYLFQRRLAVKTLIFAWLASVALVPIARADDKAEAVKKELEKLQGEWQLTTAERDGKKIPADQFKDELVTIKGDVITVTKGGKLMQTSRLTLDLTTSPKTFVREVTDGVNKGMKYHGIYELEGDTLTDCYTVADKERPKEFSSKNGARLFVSKRVKP
jgi:uncharacterized protein (TIGR03067 family)